MASIMDENAEAKAPRKVVFELTFIPDAGREVLAISMQAKAKLPADKGQAAMAYLGQHRGKGYLCESHPRQLDLDDYTRDGRTQVAVAEIGGENAG